MQLGYSILVSTSGFQTFERSLQAPANAQTCLLAEAETSRSAWYPRMQVLVEFVLHGPSSAFPCVTNDYAPYKQQVLFAVLRLYATDPRVCDVAAAAARNGAERAPYAGHTRRTHKPLPPRAPPECTTHATFPSHCPRLSMAIPPCGYTRLRAAGAKPAIGSPLRNKPTPKRRVRPVWRSYAQRTC